MIIWSKRDGYNDVLPHVRNEQFSTKEFNFVQEILWHSTVKVLLALLVGGRMWYTDTVIPIGWRAKNMFCQSRNKRHFTDLAWSIHSICYRQVPKTTTNTTVEQNPINKYIFLYASTHMGWAHAIELTTILL